VLKEEPSDVLAHYNLAVSYFNLNRLEDSIKELKAVLALASDQGDALEQVTTPARELLGTITMQQKNYTLARTQFEELLTVAPQDYAANFNLGWLAGQDGNAQEGIRYLKVAVETDPSNADGYAELGTLYLSLGDLANAEGQFAEAARLAPNSASAHYNLGIVFAKEQDKDRAVNEFTHALQADPGFRPASEALQRIQQQ
jgi:tetratricopeptide (TPR) repeat protein